MSTATEVIRVTPEVKNEVKKLRIQLSAKRQRILSYGDVITEILDAYLEQEGKK